MDDDNYSIDDQYTEYPRGKCKKDFVENEKTGRCLKKCDETHERNRSTNRCLKKCKDTQTRNPDTGRCTNKTKKKSKKEVPTFDDDEEPVVKKKSKKKKKDDEPIFDDEEPIIKKKSKKKKKDDEPIFDDDEEPEPVIKKKSKKKKKDDEPIFDDDDEEPEPVIKKKSKKKKIYDEPIIKKPLKKKKKDDDEEEPIVKPETPTEEDTEEEPVVKENITLNCILKNDIKLKKHQLNVIENLLTKRGLVVKHGTGSGKTLTSIACAEILLENYEHLEKVIVIAPYSLQDNYRKEMRKFGIMGKHAEKYEIYTYEKFLRMKETDITNDCKNTFLIIDEAHNLRTEIKETKKKVFGKKVKNILACAKKAFKILLLTATPIVNNEGDLINMITFINKKTQKNYSEQNIIDELKCKYSEYDVSEDKEQIKEYPKTKNIEFFIEMNDETEEQYRTIEEDLEGKGQTILRRNKTEEQKEKQLHVFYNGIRRGSNSIGGEQSQKITEIINIINKFKNKNKKYRILIFSNYIEDGVDLITKRIDIENDKLDIEIKYDLITGKTKSSRQEIVDKYNKGKLNVLFISSAGSEGLDLKETNAVIITEPSWNYSKIKQVIGRAVRYKSHSNIPEDKRIVYIYQLYLITKEEYKNIDILKNSNSEGEYTLDGEEIDLENKLSVDLYLRNYSKNKEKHNDELYEKLKEVSIENKDCDKYDIQDIYEEKYKKKGKIKIGIKYDKLDNDTLVPLLHKYIKLEDKEKTKTVLQILLKRDDFIDTDEEIKLYDEKWVVEIIFSIEKLDFNKIYKIQRTKLFKKYLDKLDINKDILSVKSLDNIFIKLDKKKNEIMKKKIRKYFYKKADGYFDNLDDNDLLTMILYGFYKSNDDMKIIIELIREREEKTGINTYKWDLIFSRNYLDIIEKIYKLTGITEREIDLIEDDKTRISYAKKLYNIDE